MEEIYLKKQISDDEQFLGEWLDESYYDILVENDCRIFKPPNIEGEKEVLAIFKKSVFLWHVNSFVKID